MRLVLDQIAKLEMLEELVLSENHLEELPSNLTTMAMLRVLKVQTDIAALT